MWERRYAAVKPERSANGRRQYTQEDAERLCLIAELTSKGQPISSVATLTLRELEERIRLAVRATRTTGVASEVANELGGSPVSAMYTDRMVSALESFQLRELSAQLTTARANQSVSDFIFLTMLPLLSCIGTMVENERLSVAHEHALSAILKSQIYLSIYQLGSQRFRVQDAGSPPHLSLVIATQEGDHHEFGILLASLLAELHGVTTHFLGSNMPARPLADAANALKTSVVLIGRTIRMPLISADGQVVTQKGYLKELDRSLRADMEIWVGGVLEENALKFSHRHKLIHLSSLQIFVQRLSEKFSRQGLTHLPGLAL
jgi:methanogenic corrinoid protein MtbC1